MKILSDDFRNKFRENTVVVNATGYGDWSVHADMFFQDIKSIVDRAKGYGKMVSLLEYVKEGGILRSYDYSEKKLLKYCQQIGRKDQIVNLALSCFAHPENQKLECGPGYFPIEIEIQCGEDVFTGLDPKKANEITLRYASNVMGDFYTDQELVELLQRWVRELNASTGFVTKSYEMNNPLNFMETSAARDENIVVKEHMREKLRGYFWGNVLTEKHMELLGGMETIKTTAPCKEIQEWEMENGETALYLQSTESLHNFIPQNRLEMKNFFRPLLYRENLIDLLDEYPNPIEIGIVLDKEEQEKWDYYMEMDEKDRKQIIQERTDELVARIRRRQQEHTATEEKQEYTYTPLDITEDVEPDGLPITFVFQRIGKKAKEELGKLIDSWGMVGLYDGYETRTIRRIEPIEWEGNTGCFYVELGCGCEKALKSLEQMVICYCYLNSLQLKKFETKDYEAD